MPLPAARLTDMHTCPMWTGVVPHVGGPVTGPGSPKVMIGGMPAACMGDMVTCVGPPDTIVFGVPTILIGGKPAATMSAVTAHGGVIVGGCPKVQYGGAAPPAPPPPPPPPDDLSPEEVAFMQAGHSPEELQARREEERKKKEGKG